MTRIEEIQKGLKEITPGLPWQAAHFVKPDGSPIKTKEDIKEILCRSVDLTIEHAEKNGINAMYLYGVVAPEGKGVVFTSYTGNGPRSLPNAHFIANAPTDIKFLLEENERLGERVLELLPCEPDPALEESHPSKGQ